MPRSQVRDLYSSFASFHRLFDKRGYDRLGVLACHLGQHHVTRMTLDQGRDVAVVRPGQQIALPDDFAQLDGATRLRRQLLEDGRSP